MKFILIIILLYILFRLLSRWAFPYFVKRYINQVQKKYYEQNQQNSTYQDNDKKVIIETPLRKKSKPNLDDLGELTNFEEVKETE